MSSDAEFSGSTPLTAEHKLVALGIFAHREVGRLAVFPLGLAVAAAAGGRDFGGAGHDIGDLKRQTRPGAHPLAAAVDRDQAPGDGEFGDVRILADDLGPKARGVKSGGPLGIGGPDGVF